MAHLAANNKVKLVAVPHKIGGMATVPQGTYVSAQGVVSAIRNGVVTICEGEGRHKKILAVGVPVPKMRRLH